MFFSVLNYYTEPNKRITLKASETNKSAKNIKNKLISDAGGSASSAPLR
jgi:hypothetical protein